MSQRSAAGRQSGRGPWNRPAALFITPCQIMQLLIRASEGFIMEFVCKLSGCVSDRSPEPTLISSSPASPFTELCRTTRRWFLHKKN